MNPNVFIQLTVSAGRNRKRHIPKELDSSDVLRQIDTALRKALKDSGHPDWKCTIKLVMA